jgi:hypothetical protein
MPKPRIGEQKDAYISRCIPIVIQDGTAKDEQQAYAICNSMYDESKMSAYEKEIKKYR